MDPERWRQVDELFQDALARLPEERDTFLRHACGADRDLAREVRSLLTAQRQTGGFLDTPAIDVAARALAREQGGDARIGADELIGRTVSHYRVIEKLGGGGMGVVYRAEDTRLQRPVALKFLSSELAPDPDASTRFQREARAASALNHPNICTVYDIGEQDARAFIAMECLDGTTLKARIAGGAIDADTLMTVSMEILDALDTAHAAGIIHRDINPANLVITSRGRTKILDFGLAKIYSTGPAALMAATVAMDLTAAGTAIGTLPYMSPEQVRGQDVDTRTDLFSFGVVLYEMATGAHPFQGQTAGLIFDGILNRDPPPASSVNPEVSPDLEHVIQKCLAKTREGRYQHAADIRIDLQRLTQATGSGLATQPERSGARRWRVMVLAVAGVIAAMIAGISYFRRAPTLVLTDRDAIVLADFSNTTGDPVFDDILRQGLSVQLGQSPFLSLVSDGRIQQQLQLMGRPADAPLTAAVAKDLCERNGSAAVLAGSIASLGRQYVLGLRAERCTTGDVLFDEQAQASRKENVLDVLSRMATTFRTGVGETLASVERHSTPLAEATTPSLAALKAYTAARKIALSSNRAEAVTLYERAVELDPEFAMAHASLGISYSNLGETVKSKESTARAYQLRNRASDRERFYITTMYDRQVTGNLEREQRTLESWAQTYPRDPDPRGLLAGFATMATGKFELGIESASKAIAIDPDNPLSYESLAFANLHSGRLADAEAAIEGASQRKLEVGDLLLLRYLVAFLKNDHDGMGRAAALAKGKEGAEDWMAHVQALVLARSGRIQEARRASEFAIDVAEQSGRQERAAMFEAAAAIWEAFAGNAAGARRSASAALQRATGRDVEYAAAFALALAGESAQPRALADDLDRRFPEDTSVRFNYLPTLRALIALNVREPAVALELLQPHTRFDLAMHGLAFNGFFGGLHSVYVRGQAYLAAGRPADAATEFQKVLDHPGIVLGDPMGAMARLQLARARALTGDTAKAKATYQELLTLWKAADADMTPLRQARTEYARLH